MNKEIDIEHIKRLYNELKPVSTRINVDIGYIGKYIFNTKLCMKAICLDKCTFDRHTLILLSGMADGTLIYRWFPLDFITSISPVKFSNNNIRKIFKNQLELYNENELSDKKCLELNKQILEALGYIFPKDFLDILRNKLTKKLGSTDIRCYLTIIGSPKYNFKHGLLIKENINLGQEDSIAVEDIILSQEKYKNAVIDKNKGVIYKKSNSNSLVSSVIDLSYIYKNDSTNVDLSYYAEKCYKSGKLGLLNEKLISEKCVYYNEEDGFYYNGDIFIPLDVSGTLGFVTVKDTKYILNELNLV